MGVGHSLTGCQLDSLTVNTDSEMKVVHPDDKEAYSQMSADFRQAPLLPALEKSLRLCQNPLTGGDLAETLRVDEEDRAVHYPSAPIDHVESLRVDPKRSAMNMTSIVTKEKVDWEEWLRDTGAGRPVTLLTPFQMATNEADHKLGERALVVLHRLPLHPAENHHD
eukprot:NODE_15151_length_1065_cov_6.030917.p2 GENE.NODE_15151_length_1065_cov_6.030917~~NODE_15151_length_1065_cov_6.030917.p2  ORF type:complete len:166 (+),score=20.55 NODE_15151_length_1065_cov_6.030917:159-656(+)